eukprot:873436-Heterocapsa_arctica.AAC.1
MRSWLSLSAFDSMASRIRTSSAFGDASGFPHLAVFEVHFPQLAQVYPSCTGISFSVATKISYTHQSLV